jgi:hypothetical protein
VTSPAIPALRIRASSALPRVSGHVLVLFEGGRYATARIRATITGAAPGDVVSLMASRFPFRRAPAVIASRPLTSATGSYSFTVRPRIATRYRVQLSRPGAGLTPLARSAARTVYLTPGGRVMRKQGCGTGPFCRPAYRFYVYLPGRLVRGYLRRHWFVYVGKKRSARRVPRQPYWLSVDQAATVSAPRRITRRQYEVTVGFSFYLGQDAARWNVLTCEQDTEAADGIGLPGRHGCGSHRIRRTVAYLG